MIRYKKHQFSTMRTLCTLASTAVVLATVACGDDDQGSKRDPGCVNDEVVCSDRCVDLRSDPSHCGNCDIACTESKVCSLGSCKDQCHPGLHNCGQACVNIHTDPNHCGACQSACETGKFCALGVCTSACNDECGMVCTDTGMDAFNCGDCGVRCDGDQVCADGKCVGVCEWSGSCGGCSILSASYDFGAANPGNPCEVCDPQDTSWWTALEPGAECGDGMVCSEDNECFKPMSFCTIGGVDYAFGDSNPSNSCQTCSASNPTEWSGSDKEGTACDEVESGICSDNGVCIRPVEISAMSAQSYHTCVVTQGVVKCWGNNGTGQIGSNIGESALAPVAVTSLGFDALAVSTGDKFSCAISMLGNVYCWGANSNGELGCEVCPAPTPCQIGWSESPFAAISSGYLHICAVIQEGAVMCWGQGEFGQRGSPTPLPIEPTSTTPPMSNVTSISSSRRHTCAASASEVWCWGSNSENQIDTGSSTSYDYPRKVTAVGTGVVSVVAGQSHTCALTQDNKIKCWGDNAHGQLGIGTTEPTKEVVIVPGISAKSIAAGRDHTCAITVSGGVMCWGYNFMGQLGDGTVDNSPSPRQVHGLTQNVIGIAAGSSHTCAFTNVAAKCWGANYDGQLGNNSLTISLTPVYVLFP